MRFRPERKRDGACSDHAGRVVHPLLFSIRWGSHPFAYGNQGRKSEAAPSPCRPHDVRGNCQRSTDQAHRHASVRHRGALDQSPAARHIPDPYRYGKRGAFEDCGQKHVTARLAPHIRGRILERRLHRLYAVRTACLRGHTWRIVRCFRIGNQPSAAANDENCSGMSRVRPSYHRRYRSQPGNDDLHFFAGFEAGAGFDAAARL